MTDVHVSRAHRTPIQLHAESTLTFEACVFGLHGASKLPSSLAGAAREVTPVYLDASTVF